SFLCAMFQLAAFCNIATDQYTTNQLPLFIANGCSSDTQLDIPPIREHYPHIFSVCTGENFSFKYSSDRQLLVRDSLPLLITDLVLHEPLTRRAYAVSWLRNQSVQLARSRIAANHL